MAYEHLCMYCFEDRQGQAICPHCGRDSRAAVPQIQMLPGTLVYHDRFLVGRALGQDATGIVYSAFDTKRENKLRLREYLPRDCSERLNDGSVVPLAGLEDQFEKGMKKLRASVEGVEDPHKRHFFFTENGTAYIAQRKNAGGAAAASSRSRVEDDDEGSGLKQVGIIVGIAAAVVIIAAIVIISLMNGALNSADDIVQNPTLGPTAVTNVWAPEETPTPTPYASPTFAALVDPEQSWMDYTYSGNVNQEFDDKVNLSATATPRPTIRPQATQNTTVGGNSSSDDVIELQQRLSQLGWLPSSGITGSYDAATKQAVKDFQNYVNTVIRPAEKLSVDGIAGPKTQQWLYGTDSVKPTPTPTPAVTPDPNQKDTVDKDSPKIDIQAVQRKLIVLGLMPSGSDDGVYGTTTTAAVKKFQQRVNQLQGYAALPISGVVDPDTMAYLNYYVEWWLQQQQATATPTPTRTPEPVIPTTPSPSPTVEPTDAPDIPEGGNVVDKDSPKESVAFVQEMLIGVGLLPSGSNDGVYGSGTTNAVLKFQKWVNSVQGAGTLAETGIADQDTLNYLEYAYGNGMTAPGNPTEAPATATPEPVPTEAPATATPEPAPTEEPSDEPDLPEGGTVVDKDSPKESIAFVQEMLIGVGLLPSGSNDGVYGSGTSNAVLKFQQWVNSVQGAGTLAETGIADQNTLNCLEYAYGNGMTAPDANPTATPEPVPTEAPATATPEPAPTEEPVDEPDIPEGGNVVDKDSPKESVAFVQEMLIGVGLLPEGSNDGVFGSGTANAISKFQQWVNSVQGEGTLPVTGVADQNTLNYLEYAYGNGMTAAPQATAPAEAPTKEPPAQPVELSARVDGAEAINGVYVVNSDRITFQWNATGNISGYYIYVTDSNGGSFYSDEASGSTQLAFGASELAPGMIYTIQVGALPEGDDGSGMVVRTAQFGIPAGAQATEVPAPTETPAPTATAAPEPIELSLNISGTEMMGGVHAITGDKITFNWSATGNVASYDVVITDRDGGVFKSYSGLTEPKGVFSASDLTTGMIYTIKITANPAHGGEPVSTTAQFGVPTPPATEAPTPTPAPTNTPEPTATPEPMKISLKISGTEVVDGVHMITGGSIAFQWNVNREVIDYHVIVTDSLGGEFFKAENVTDPKGTFSAASLMPGEIYTIKIGANLADGSETVWKQAQFSLPAGEELPEGTEDFV